MKYTVRFCHLEKPSKLEIGQNVKTGDLIGRMGNSGTSLIHLHLDIVEGWHPEVYRLVDILNYITDLQVICMLYFIFLSDDLFKTPLHVTSHFGTIDYGHYASNGKIDKWVFHPAYDVVPENRQKTNNNYNIYWPAMIAAEVLSKGIDGAYGNYVNIRFEV